ncbi:MAG: class I SAM-dependent methyltransferase [Candidatus Binatia bacterium]|nr:class I SAM-dependent methyltransferase [Candidatus Binatia bacterium]
MTERATWDRRYETADPPAPPSPFVVAQATALAAAGAPGRALDLACGAGRHVRLLADLGFSSVALDFSLAAVGRAASGPAFGVVADAGALPFRTGSFDLIVQTCFLDRALFPTLSALLRPGGVLIAETFALAQFEATGHPRREYCLGPGEFEHLCEAPETGLEITAASSADRGDEKKPRHLCAIAARRA